MSKIKKSNAAPNTADRPKSSLEGLAEVDIKTFKGLFTAWARQVPSKEDPAVKVLRYKCVAQVPTKENPDIYVDITAWISAEAAAKHGIENGTSFVGTFAYSGLRLESPRGQYNEERSLSNSRLVAVA